MSAQFWRLARCIGKKKAAVAVGHSILVIAWHLLTEGCDYEDLGGEYFVKRDADRARQRAVALLEALAITSRSKLRLSRVHPDSIRAYAERGSALDPIVRSRPAGCETPGHSVSGGRRRWKLLPPELPVKPGCGPGDVNVPARQRRAQKSDPVRTGGPSPLSGDVEAGLIAVPFGLACWQVRELVAESSAPSSKRARLMPPPGEGLAAVTAEPERAAADVIHIGLPGTGREPAATGLP